MQQSRFLRIRLIFILGLLAMLMPMGIDMYLPAFPGIAREFGVGIGHVQLTLSIYIFGFALGQLFYGPLADSVGRKPVIVMGTLAFTVTCLACAWSKTVEQLIFMRFFHGLAAAAASVVINALIRDMFNKEEFSRILSYVILVMTMAPLVAPMLGGLLLSSFGWQAIFWSIAAASLLTTLLVVVYIKETLPAEKRQPFQLRVTLRNFASLFRHKQVLFYMLSSSFSFSGLFSFLSAGPFVYIDLHGVSAQHFGYYFAVNVIFLFIMTMINSHYVNRFGAITMLRFGLTIQFVMGIFLLLSSLVGLPFWTFVLAIAGYTGCIAVVSANAMAVIMTDFPHMAGTVSSLAGTLRFGVAAIVGTLLAVVMVRSEWPMVLSMVFCVTMAVSFFLLANQYAKQNSY